MGKYREALKSAQPLAEYSAGIRKAGRPKLPKESSRPIGKRVPGGPSEADILQSILCWLKLKKIVHRRMNTQGTLRYIDKQNMKLTPSSAKGLSDILGALPSGKLFAIEVKAPGGRVSASQDNWLDEVTGSNGLAFIALSLDDVLMQFAREGVR